MNEEIKATEDERIRSIVRDELRRHEILKRLNGLGVLFQKPLERKQLEKLEQVLSDEYRREF